MIGEVIVVGDLKLRKDAALDEYGRLGERMYNIVSNLPGFLSVKSFKAEDGEEITVFRFASEEALEAWRTHPEHVATMKRGHAEFYSGGASQSMVHGTLENPRKRTRPPRKGVPFSV